MLRWSFSSHIHGKFSLYLVHYNMLCNCEIELNCKDGKINTGKSSARATRNSINSENKWWKLILITIIVSLSCHFSLGGSVLKLHRHSAFSAYSASLLIACDFSEDVNFGKFIKEVYRKFLQLIRQIADLRILNWHWILEITRTLFLPRGKWGTFELQIGLLFQRNCALL